MEIKETNTKKASKMVYKATGSTGPESVQQPEGVKITLMERFRGVSVRLVGGNQVVLLAGLLAALLVIIALVVYFISQIGTYKISQPVYRFDTGLQIFHQGNTKLRRRDNVLYLKNQGEESSIQPTPLYFTEMENKMLLPELMVIMQPGKSVPPVRTPYFTTLDFEGNTVAMLRDNKQLANVADGFLFDGKDQYVFLEDMTILYMGQRVEMPAMSYAVVLYDTRIELYPYQGTPVIQQTGKAIVTARNSRGTFQLDLSQDILTDESGEYLLFSDISLLKEVKEGWPGVS